MLFEDSDVEHLRRQLPLHTYLHLLHVGAVTGYIPRYSPAGRPVPQAKQTTDGTFLEAPDGLDGRTRVQIIQYLIDKAMPALKSDTPGRRVDSAARRLSLTDLRSMSNDELMSMLGKTASPAPAGMPAVEAENDPA
jgi:hypothetical protein